MILIDANLLLYATFSSFTQHAKARAWLDQQLSTIAQVALPWESLLAFLRLATNPRVMSQPLTSEQATRQIETWLARQNVWTPLPTETHVQVLAHVLRSANATADLIPDAHLAALAMQHGLTVCSADRDFARFPGISWINPLAA